MAQPGLPIVLISPLAARFHRGIFQGVMAFGRQQHPRWRITCHTDAYAVDYRALRPAGVLLTSGDPSLEDHVRRAGVEYVLCGHDYPASTAPSVTTDEAALGQTAADYLLGLGLRHFAFVGHGEWSFVHARGQAFRQAIEAARHDSMHYYIGTLYDGRKRRGFMSRLRALIKNLPRPCGVLAANDDLGATIISTGIGLELRVPEDVAVLGVDDDEVACEMSEVPLSSIAQPLQAIGYESARMLQGLIQGRKPTPFKLRLPPMRVVARSSTDLINLGDPDVVAALRLINAHFADPINVDWLVAQLPVARRSLERNFKAHVGRTLLEHLRFVRLQKARELLAESDLGLEVVAQRSGFNNARWLADNFRRYLKLTPTRYRQQFRAVG